MEEDKYYREYILDAVLWDELTTKRSKQLSYEIYYIHEFLVNDQLDALFFNVFISTPLHVSSSKCLSSGEPTFINTSFGIKHFVSKRV